MKKEVFIPIKIESGNIYRYANKWLYKKYKDTWHKAIAAAFGHIQPEEKKKFIKIISKRGRIIDQDNLITGAKPIPDALQKCGWIKNDNIKWTKIEYEQISKCKKEEEGTLITVEELEDENRS